MMSPWYLWIYVPLQDRDQPPLTVYSYWYCAKNDGKKIARILDWVDLNRSENKLLLQLTIIYIYMKLM